MANTKTYTVVKDGEPIKELKTLAAAKKLADAEGAEVFCEGACVYSPTLNDYVLSEELSTPVVEEAKVEEPVETAAPLAEEPKAPDTYTLLRRMNVRRTPSVKAERVNVLNAGAVVEVTEVADDWLHLTDDTFILYESGKNARKN